MSAMTRTRATAQPTIYRTTTKAGTLVWVAQKRWTEEGRRRSLKGQGASAVEALERLRAREGVPEYPEAVRGPQKPVQRVQKSRTVEAYGRTWSNARKVSETVRRKDLRALELHVFPRIGARALTTITGEDLVKLFTTLEDDGLGPGGRRNVYRVLSGMLNYAVKRGTIKNNPLQRVQRPKNRHLLRQTEMEQRIELVLQMLDMNYPPARDEARIRVGLLGLRPSEALGLTWDDLEMEFSWDQIMAEYLGGEPIMTEPRIKSILVRRQLARHEITENERGYYLKAGTKTGQERRVPVDAETSKALMTWKAEQRRGQNTPDWCKGLVFTRDDGLYITQNADRARWKELLTTWQEQHDTVDIFPVGYLRKISITLLRDSGVPDSVVAAMMGHTPVVEDRHYYAPQFKAQADAIDKLATAIQKGSL